ncbi:hypothetical protein FRC01_002906, partial [Tulasnella sp. 417]
MEVIIATMKGQNARLLQDADGWWRLVYTVIMAYLADLEEQWLILGLSKNRCPHCLAGYHDLDTPGKCAARTAQSILETIKHVQEALPSGYTAYQFVKAAQKEGLCGVERPFWISFKKELGQDLCHILCSNLLHGCHKFWNDHIDKWMVNWTCRQTRELQKTFLPTIIDAPSQAPSLSNRLVRANHVALDYIQIAQYPCHTDQTLTELTTAIQNWQKEKWVFVENGGRKGDDSGKVINHFRIPKNHSPEHFVEHIKARGSLVGQSTEQLERYHPLVSKNGYHLINHKSHELQLLQWLNRHKRISAFFHYLRWWTMDYDWPGVEQEINLDGDGLGLASDDESWGDVHESELATMDVEVATTGDVTSKDSESSLEGKRLTKTPHRKNATLDQLAHDHNIPGLKYALADYFRWVNPAMNTWPKEFEFVD